MGQFRNFVYFVRLCFLLATGVAIWGACNVSEGRERLAQLSQVQRSPEWRKDYLQNPQAAWMDKKKVVLQRTFARRNPASHPNQPVSVFYSHGEAFSSPPSSGLRVTWFGHASALVEIDGSRLLLDPFWGERASPIPWAGPKRWYAPPIPLHEMPTVDAVLISHDHYDHLDFSTITAMKSWKTVFIVPLGVGEILLKWGIPPNRIIELDWWQSTQFGRIRLTATPARHYSGRSLIKGNRTLWAGWAMTGSEHRVWYSGDTGYQVDFAKIGERLGPFDVTLIEVGEYGNLWPDYHLGPEQAAEVDREVRGKVIIPVHWGLLQLAYHGWTEPAERVLVAARCYGVEVLIPHPGESVEPTQHPHIAA